MNTVTTEDKIKVKEGYMQTPIGILPREWKIQKMKDMGEFYRGKGIPKKDLVEEGLKAIRYGEIYTVHHYFIKEFYSFINEETASKSFLLNKGDVLFTGSGETLEDIGKSVAFISDDKAYAGGDISILRPKVNSYNSKYLGFVTNNDIFRRQTYRAGQGQSVVHIYPSNLKEIKLPIPPLPEQKVIADCLSTWDKGIEKLSALIASKKEQKKGLMQQLLTGKKRLDGFTEEWKEVRLEDISIRKSSTVQARSLIENSGDYNVYGASGFITKIDHFDEEEPYIGIVKDGSGVGNLFLLEGKSSVLGTLDKILPKNSNLVFLYGLLKRLNFEKYKVGGAIPHIYYKDYSKERVMIPSIDEQTAIAEVLTTTDKEIELLEKKLEIFKIQKKGLMQVLLTGEKRLLVDN